MLLVTIILALAPHTPQDPAAPTALICATGRGTRLELAELDELLLLRNASSPAGQEILRHLLEARLVEAIAAERGVHASAAEVTQRISDLKEQMHTDGTAQSLNDYLKSSGVDPEVFAIYLRLAILQEKLTRLALGIEEGAIVSGEQQSSWINAEIERRGVVRSQPPFHKGVVLTCPPVQLKVSEFLDHLRTQLPETELREACYHLLLVHRIRRRMPDVSPAEIDRAVEREVARRRKAAESDPAYAGIPFERLLASQGLSLDALTRDPTVSIAALSGLYVDRAYGDDGLRAAYNTEREYFDGHYGEALGVRALFLRAARFTNEFIPRTFAAAESEMNEMLAAIEGEDEFLLISKARSEAQGELAKGALHWMPVLDKQIGAALVSEAFARWGGRSELPEDPRERLIGPTRTPKGIAVLWLSARRPAPAWASMALHVRQDLRRRFLADVLEPSHVVMDLAGIPGD
jgi:hypothetical protein